MKTVCFLPLHAPSWKEMRPLALALGQGGRARPVVLASGGLAPRLLADCQQAGLQAILLPEIDPYGRQGPLTAWLRRAREKAEVTWPLLGGQTAGQARFHRQRLARQHQEIERLWDSLRPAALVTLDGRKYGWQLPALQVCRQRGTRVVLPPVALAARPLELAQRNQGPQYLAGGFPSLLRRHPGQALWDPARQAHIFFFPAPVVAALGAHGMLPPNPWVVGGGWPVTVMVEGQDMWDFHASSGLDPGRMLLTGHAAHDALHQGLARRDDLRQDLGRRYSLDPGAPLALITPLALAEQGVWRADHQRRENEFLCQVMAQELTAAGGQGLVSLHPKADPRDYGFMEERYGLTVVRERIEEVLPAMDVFLASFSSTVPWAALCRVPTLVFAFHGLSYDFFDHLRGVRVLPQREDLAPDLRRLLRDPAYHQETVRALAASARGLSPFDGLCTQRILEAILPDGGA
ncbi:MAG: hypothetical protein HY910_13060 [Desulfarculus sp.]|nr:hypothetical protein [Desulfarculus sp.]